MLVDALLCPDENLWSRLDHFKQHVIRKYGHARKDTSKLELCESESFYHRHVTLLIVAVDHVDIKPKSNVSLPDHLQSVDISSPVSHVPATLRPLPVYPWPLYSGGALLACVCSSGKVLDERLSADRADLNLRDAFLVLLYLSTFAAASTKGCVDVHHRDALLELLSRMLKASQRTSTIEHKQWLSANLGLRRYHGEYGDRNLV